MNIVSASRYQSIINYLETIGKKPKKEVKFFFLEDEHKFIVDGNKLRCLPISYHRYYVRQEFYVQVDMKEKIVKFYAFDRKAFTDPARVNEASGTMPWDNLLEESVYNFFVSNIRELTNETYVHTSAESKSNSGSSDPRISRSNRGRSDGGGIPSHQTGGSTTQYQHQQSYHSYSPPTSSSLSSSYQSEDYKEREKILDRMRVLQANNKSAQAIEFVDEHIPSLLRREKFSIVDDILRILYPDKLPIPVAIELLHLTSNHQQLKERSIFLSKVSDHVKKINPRRAHIVLSQFGGR